FLSNFRGNNSTFLRISGDEQNGACNIGYDCAPGWERRIISEHVEVELFFCVGPGFQFLIYPCRGCAMTHLDTFFTRLSFEFSHPFVPGMRGLFLQLTLLILSERW